MAIDFLIIYKIGILSTKVTLRHELLVNYTYEHASACVASRLSLCTICNIMYYANGVSRYKPQHLCLFSDPVPVAESYYDGTVTY